jgi:hypothetical protein
MTPAGRSSSSDLIECRAVLVALKTAMRRLTAVACGQS